MTDIKQNFSPKQLEFIANADKKWNIAHGSVRSGKTEGTLFAFMLHVMLCPDSKIYMVGHTSDSIKRNAVDLILYGERFEIFRPFCSFSDRKLYFKDKIITTLGAKDEGAIGNFQGDTYSLVYCDEMTLYPLSIINMIDSRLSPAHSKGFATMNPSFPDHPIKKWINEAEAGSDRYYALHFMLDDNPFVDANYKKRMADSLSGIFYKRNYLGLWCLAEGAIFDFFDTDIYVVSEPPRATTDYWIAAVDYGTNNAFACVVIAVSTGQNIQVGKQLCVVDEYYYAGGKDNKKQKTSLEYANDLVKFLEPYGITHLYIDPSALSFKTELARRGIHCINADNDVENGIITLTSEMKSGRLLIKNNCRNLIKEIENYVWDPAAAKKGLDKPLKQSDHCIDCTRYCVQTHKVATYNPYAHNPKQYVQSRFGR